MGKGSRLIEPKPNDQSGEIDWVETELGEIKAQMNVRSEGKSLLSTTVNQEAGRNNREESFD